MDRDKCFDHVGRPSGGARAAFGAWFVFCVLFALALAGVGVWAVVALVQWVTSK
ncbi:hypothetical protein [Luteipulveratus mongoliensis]|nr:hypothetical protein [Luteipulveratus mongoliensis]